MLVLTYLRGEPILRNWTAFTLPHITPTTSRPTSSGLFSKWGDGWRPDGLLDGSPVYDMALLIAMIEHVDDPPVLLQRVR
jgi:hypothetical protein